MMVELDEDIFEFPVCLLVFSCRKKKKGEYVRSSQYFLAV